MGHIHESLSAQPRAMEELRTTLEATIQRSQDDLEQVNKSISGVGCRYLHKAQSQRSQRFPSGKGGMPVSVPCGGEPPYPLLIRFHPSLLPSIYFNSYTSLPGLNSALSSAGNALEAQAQRSTSLGHKLTRTATDLSALKGALFGEAHASLEELPGTSASSVGVASVRGVVDGLMPLCIYG